MEKVIRATKIYYYSLALHCVGLCWKVYSTILTGLSLYATNFVNYLEDSALVIEDRLILLGDDLELKLKALESS